MRQTSRRSSSISTQTPAAAGKTTWSPGCDRHLDSRLRPPVEPGPDGQHDPLFGRRLVSAGRDDQPGAPHPVLVELLDHDLVEQRPQLVADRLGGVRYLRGAHADLCS